MCSVFQEFVNEQQHAFLPGRSIFHSLILINEVLHKTLEMDKDFVLLKVDTIKAFDCIGWTFLFALLDKVGFGPRFLRMLLATNATTSSPVLLQG